MKYLLGALLAMAIVSPAYAADSAEVITTCGGQTYQTGAVVGLTQDTTGKLCTAGAAAGGSSAVYGPTANGSPAANPPVLMGGTADGTGTGNVGNAKIDSSGNQYAKTVPQAATTTNANSTVATGGTFQQIVASNTSRQSFDFQNRSGNGDNCYLFFGSAAASIAASIKVLDGQEYIRSTGVVPSDKISVTCDTNGDAYWAATQ